MFFDVLVLLASVSSICLAAEYTDKANTDDLIALVQVFRHGDRTPTSFYPKDPYSDLSYWPEGVGQLIKRGKQRHYDLGKFTKERYGDFIPRNYHKDRFHAQTTDVDRTHMSAQSNIAAIFPPDNTELFEPELSWQPIPIHPSNTSVISSIPTCAIYYAEWTKVLVESDPFAQLNAQYSWLYEYLTNNSGSDISSLLTVWTLSDTLLVEQERGYELPEWTKSVFPEPLRQLTSYAFLSLSYTDDQKKLFAGSWLNTVIEYFEGMSKNASSSPEFQIYSAHDANIASILNTLGAFKLHAPAYASTLYFELRNKEGTPVINILHKDEDRFEPIVIQNCQFDCPLTDFRRILTPWLVDSSGWTELCNSDETSYASISDVDAEELRHVHNHVHQHSKVMQGKWHHPIF